MSVKEYSLRFNVLAAYAPDIVSTISVRAHHYVDSLGDHLIRDYSIAFL